MKTLANKNGETITDILSKIKIAASSGKEYLYLTHYCITGNHKQELEIRGFKVDIGGRYNETNTHISWK